MKYLATSFLLLISVSDVGAAAQLNAARMTCADLQMAVEQSGSAIVPYQSQRSPGLSLYERYVRNSQFCVGNDITEVDFVATGDRLNCPLERCVRRDCGSNR
jgi:hypothetical protein